MLQNILTVISNKLIKFDSLVTSQTTFKISPSDLILDNSLSALSNVSVNISQITTL